MQIDFYIQTSNYPLMKANNAVSQMNLDKGMPRRADTSAPTGVWINPFICINSLDSTNVFHMSMEPSHVDGLGAFGPDRRAYPGFCP